MNLKSKYILSTTFILFVIIGIFSYNNFRLQEEELNEDEKEKVTLAADIIKTSLLTIMLQGRGREFQKFIETVINREIETACIFRPDGTIISSSLPEQIGTNTSAEHLTRFNTQKIPEVFSHKHKEKSVYSIIVPINNDYACHKCHGAKDEVIGALNVELSTEKAGQRIAESKKRTALFFIVTFLAISVFLGILTDYLVNKPITSIIDAMKKAKEGNLMVKFLTGRKDEIGNLASALNSMFSDLDRARREIEKCHFDEMQSIERMATLGEMASAIAHEIKNPLAGISGAIQVLAEDFPEKDPHKDVIIEVLGEIERLDRSVKDLLLFARPPEIYPISTPLQPIIEQAKKSIALQAKKQGIIIRSIPGENGGEIKVDPEQMQHVFLNIMQSNLQSMPAGGILTIATHFRAGEGEVEIIFSDTGHGIEQNMLKNIFKPFFTTKNIGTGLGLAISRNIVEKHNGRITVESQVGIGSAFHVILKASNS